MLAALLCLALLTAFFAVGSWLDRPELRLRRAEAVAEQGGLPARRSDVA